MLRKVNNDSCAEFVIPFRTCKNRRRIRSRFFKTFFTMISSPVEVAASSSSSASAITAYDKKWPETLCQGRRVNLGQGKTDIAPLEAAKEFLAQEFPSISDGTQTEPVFIPDFFISIKPEIVPYSEEDWKGRLNNSKVKKLKESGIMRGDKTERLAYDEFKKFFESERCEEKKTTIFHGWKNKATEVEFDLLVVCQDKKSIAIIECKSQGNQNTCSKATGQLRDRKTFLEKHFTIGPDWCIFCCIFAPEFNIKEKRDNLHYLTPSDDIETWWNTIPSHENTSDNDDTYVSLIGALTVVSFINDYIVTPSDVSHKVLDQIDKLIGTKDNILLWTKKQHKVFYDGAKKVFLASDFGTGKTILLISKCLEKANSSKEATCYFIVMPSIPRFGKQELERKTMLEISAEVKLKNASNYKGNINVKQWRQIVSEDPKGAAKFGDLSNLERRYWLLTRFINSHSTEFTNFFIDEFREVDQSFLARADYFGPGDLPKVYEHGNHLWVAYSADRAFQFPEHSYFSQPELDLNMRNCSRIREAMERQILPSNMECSNFPEGRTHFCKTRLTEQSTYEDVEKVLLEAKKFLKNDINDLAVLVDDTYFVKPIQTFMKAHSQGVVCTYFDPGSLLLGSSQLDDLGLESDVSKFFSSGRSGVVVSNMDTAQGCEFKSCIHFCGYMRKHYKGDSGSDALRRIPCSASSKPNMYCRAIVNLGGNNLYST